MSIKMKGVATAVAAAAVVAVGASAGAAQANITPINTNVRATSTNANFKILGFINLTCNSGVGFRTPASGNGPVTLFSDAAGTSLSGNPRFNGCNLGATVTTTAGWTIKAVAGSPNVVTIHVPAGGAVITGTLCGTVTIGTKDVTANYTNGTLSLTINSTSIPYTSTNCGSGNATFTGTYTLDTALTVS